jgi:hypothetical protein
LGKKETNDDNMEGMLHHL